MHKSQTKRALLTSVLALVLCVAMFASSTYAWFTDTASTGINKITSGNLDVKLEYSKDCANWADAEGATNIFSASKWEPGYTEVVYFKVTNAGSLAFDYVVSTNIAKETAGVNQKGESFKLSEFLKYDIITADAKFESREAARAAVETPNAFTAVVKDEAILEAGDAITFAMVVWMPEETGDAANHNGINIPEIQFGVSVVAHQAVAEKDSYNNEYDKNAPTLVIAEGDTTSYATINEAVAANPDATVFKVSGPIDVTKMGDLFKTAGQNITLNAIEGASAPYYDFSGKTIINANGANITINGGYIEGMNANESSGYGFQHTSGTITYNNVTINNSWTNENKATVVYNKCTFTGSYYLNTYAVPSITITDCVFDKADSRAVLVYSHGNAPITATIADCEFKAAAKGHTWAGDWTAAVEVDASYITDGATVNITNCTADANYSGIVRDKAGKNATITVDSTQIIFSQADFAQAIADKKANITLGAGNFQMVNTNYDVTITGSKATVLTITHATGNANTITFKGISIVGETTEADWQNVYTLAHAGNVVYEDCTVEGLITAYVPSSFTDCEFNNNTKDQYSVFCYGAGEHSFTDCVFNTATDEGKAVKLYNHGPMVATLNVTDCTFNASKNAGEDQKAAIEIDSTYGTEYTVNIETCTINENYTKLWSEKANNSVVTVDGTKVN